MTMMVKLEAKAEEIRIDKITSQIFHAYQLKSKKIKI